MNSMQDLEDLRKILSVNGNLLNKHTSLELIDRLQTAEKTQEVDVTPLITDHQGRPMTYWGGKSNQDPVAQSRDSAEPVMNEKIKEALLQAVMVVAYRAGDINTEDGSYATTDTDSIIRLESALCEALGTKYDDIDLEEALALLNKFPSNANDHTVQPENSDLIVHLPNSADDVVDWSGWKVCDSQPEGAVPEQQSILQLGIDQPWPMRDCVQALIDAAGILLDEKGYDRTGHENISEAKRQAQRYLLDARNAWQSPAPKALSDEPPKWLSNEMIKALANEIRLFHHVEERHPEIKPRLCACMGPQPICRCANQNRLVAYFLRRASIIKDEIAEGGE